MQQEGQTLDRLISRNLGAKHTWVVRMSAEERSDILGRIADTPLENASSLGGIPISCTDLRVAGEQAHARGEAALCDNTLATSFGCPAARLGADIVLEDLSHALGKVGSGLLAVSVSATYLSSHPASYTMLDSLAQDVDCTALLAPYVAWDDERKKQNDAALAIAEYLVCHPKVARVWYPGLLRDQRDSSHADPANAQAPNILLGGFGPVVDFELVLDARGTACDAARDTPRDTSRAANHDAPPHFGKRSHLRAMGGRLVRLTCTQDDVVAQAQAVEQALAAI